MIGELIQRGSRRVSSPDDLPHPRPVETIIALTHMTISSGARFLRAMQGLPDRDFKLERNLAQNLNGILMVAPPLTQVGITEIAGQGILVGDSDLDWNGKGYPKIRGLESTGATDVLLQPYVHHLYGFVRGDDVGELEVLGNEWYLMTGMTRFYLAPVASLKNATVTPFISDPPILK